jgi:pimeloyl-ACP methyl ester carboxylesterase
MSTIKNVVLVHGSFVDGAGWESVFHLLTRRGYNVSVAQIPTTSLEADLAATKQVIDQQDGDVVLVGHSYGGVVISEAGNHPKVKRLVYVTAFAADAGESVASLIANPPPGATVPPILPPQNGFLFLDQSKFAAAFAADVEPDKAAFMARSQLPWGVVSLEGAVTRPAWKTTELLFGGHRGWDDSAARAADDGATGRCHGAGSARQSRGLRVKAWPGRGHHRGGRCGLNAGRAGVTSPKSFRRAARLGAR